MGNLCSVTEQSQVYDGKTCYKVNGKEGCDFTQAGLNRAQSITTGLACLVSTIVVFLIMDKSKTSSKVILALTIFCTVAAAIQFFMSRKAQKDIVNGKPKC